MKRQHLATVAISAQVLYIKYYYVDCYLTGLGIFLGKVTTVVVLVVSNWQWAGTIRSQKSRVSFTIGIVWPGLTDQFNVTLIVPSVTVSPNAYNTSTEIEIHIISDITCWDKYRNKFKIMGWFKGTWVNYYGLNFHNIIFSSYLDKGIMQMVGEHI